MAEQKHVVLGVHAPTPRVPRRLIWRWALIYGVPFIAVMCAVDLLLWWLT